MFKHFFLLFFVFCLSHQSSAQGNDVQLAEHYYSKGEYDKALDYYERLNTSSPSRFYFKRLVECLDKGGDPRGAEKLLRNELNSNKGDLDLQLLMATFYDSHDESDKAYRIYNDLISGLKPSSRDVIALFNAFKAAGKNDLSFKTLEQGRKLLKDSYPLNFQFAEYYGSVGETEKMIDEYLGLLDYHPTYLSSIQRILSNQIDFSLEQSKEYELLRIALLERSQKDPSNTVYSEMLIWLFVQKNQFGSAFIHVKALDKRTESQGYLVYDLGEICLENNDFEYAKKCFDYVVELGELSPVYLKAYHASLNVRFKELTTLRKFDALQIAESVNAYQSALNLFGLKHSTVELIKELAYIQAYYSNEADSAIILLNQAVSLSGLTDIQRAEMKVLLADIHVLHGDIWEASLLYMQVDKDFKFEPIGHEAKFKNARIYYYDGEFEFAQSQLDVLKQSTSKLIANDAMNLSILITENYGLDSNYIAMNWFAKADLLIEQHQYDQAFNYFDSIWNTYPYHSLGDDILMKKAQAMELQGRWQEAINFLEELLKYYSDDILADDALFRLGILHEEHLFDKEKAAGFYRRILFEYKGSMHTEEAQKRFRVLRGEGES